MQLVQQKLAKLRHIDACLLKESQYEKGPGFDSYELSHHAAHGLSLDQVSLATKFLGRSLTTPLMIAPMTGGVELGAKLNIMWAKAAEHFGLSMGVGSQRLAIIDEKVRQSFMVRKHAPNVFLLANLGAAQLCMPDGLKNAQKAVEMIEADALFIHLNPVQEACQLNGDHNFVGLLEKLEKLSKINVPVLVREVGFGLSKESARALVNCGIAGLDCAGAGGTSWAKVESLCASDEKFQKLGKVFGEWGIPTAKSIQNVRNVSEIPLIATGGIRNGLDVAKSLGLGADLSAMAQPMLKAAMISEDALFSFIEQTLLELKVAMFASGCQNVSDLRSRIEKKARRPSL